MKDWFDDGGWNTTVLPKFRDVAAGASALGFAGLASTARCIRRARHVELGLPGNVHSEGRDTPDGATSWRAADAAILEGYPSVNIISYHARCPRPGPSKSRRCNRRPNAYVPLLHIDFWEGMTSIGGYGEIDFLEAIFYKTPQMGGVCWDSAFTWDFNAFYSYLSPDACELGLRVHPDRPYAVLVDRRVR